MKYEIQFLHNGQIIHAVEFTGTFEQATEKAEMIIAYSTELYNCDYQIIEIY